MAKKTPTKPKADDLVVPDADIKREPGQLTFKDALIKTVAKKRPTPKPPDK